MGKRLWVLVIWAVSILIGSVVLAQSIGFDDIKNKPYDAWHSDNLVWGEKATDFGKVFEETAIKPNDSVSERIQKLLKVDYDWDQRATFFIKNAFNWVLAIIGMVALIVLIYAFYQMFTAEGNEEKFKEARKFVIWATIALFVIWLSWFIVSFLFNIFEVTRDAV